MVKLLILCTSNSIRSQMAEAYFNFYADKIGLFFSAGLKKSTLNPYAIKVMAEDNIDLSDYLSKSIKAFEHTPFDYLLTVCDPEEEDFQDILDYKKLFHFPIDKPKKEGKDEEEILENFRKVRDQVKVMVLKFIGQELLTTEISKTVSE